MWAQQEGEFCTWGVFLGLQRWNWKLNPDFSCDSFTFSHPCSLQCCQGSLRKKTLFLPGCVSVPFIPLCGWAFKPGLSSAGFVLLISEDKTLSLLMYQRSGAFSSSHPNNIMQIFFPNEFLPSLTGIWALRVCEVCVKGFSSKKITWTLNELLIAFYSKISHLDWFCLSIIPEKMWACSRFISWTCSRFISWIYRFASWITLL